MKSAHAVSGGRDGWFDQWCTRARPVAHEQIANTFDSQSHEHVKSFEMLLCNCAPLIARVSIAVTLASHRLHPNPRADQGLLRASIFLHLRVPAPRGRGRLGAAHARAHIQFLDTRLAVPDTQLHALPCSCVRVQVRLAGRWPTHTQDSPDFSLAGIS